MKPITNEWIDKAEDDWIVAQQSYRARKRPVYDATVSTLNNALKNISKPGLKKPALLFLKLTNWRVCCHWCCRFSLVG
jgi:hypothetical protein